MCLAAGFSYYNSFLAPVRSFHLLPTQALADCVKDLLKPFQSDAIDLVAGIDAMGFILGTLNFVMSPEGSEPLRLALLHFYF